MDAAGKDGTIKHVMSGVNPQGVEVSSFKVPSAEEIDHDYLWRYAKRMPGRGTIGIFNRSYYEETLVVRVHKEILLGQHLPASAKRGDVWSRRFREINDWERYLTDNGIRIVKLFLNVSPEEQKRRFMRRIDELERNWKFSPADIRERAPLGRLPAGLRRGPEPHQHRARPVVRDPGRPEVADAAVGRGGDPGRAGAHRPQVPGDRRRGARGHAGGERGAARRGRLTWPGSARPVATALGIR